MLLKTKCIILHQIKYSDSGLIVQAYTRESGRLSFMVKGMRSKRSGKHNALFQPLSMLDVILYYKESRNIHLLREFSVSYTPSGIFSDVRKSCIAVFLGEMMCNVLREESQNHELFDHIGNSVKYLNEIKTGFSNFHIAFLIGLCSYLGFEPGKRTVAYNRYFDLADGRFVAIPPVHGNYANEVISDILAGFFSASYESMSSIPLTGSLRNEVLETMVKYYSTHLPLLKKVNSLQVLKEIFS